LNRKASRPKASSRDKLRTMPTRIAAEESADLPVSLGKRNVVICLLLVAMTLALYGPVFRYPFVNYDDGAYVTHNKHIQSGLGWSTIKWAFTATDAANWHPLTWLSHALDWQLFGPDSRGHHATSVLIHALSAAVLFLLLFWATGREKPSLFVAALFAFHPINVESVAWIAERKNVLCTFFFLAALGAYGWYAQRPSWRRYLAVTALFLAGLMAKPMAITLPFVLFLLDYWPLRRVQGSVPGPLRLQQKPVLKLALEKAPLLGLCLLSAILTLHAQEAQIISTVKLSLGVRLENALVAYPTYLWNMVWPARLALLYPHPGGTLKPWQLLLSAVVLLSITALAWVLGSRRYLPVGWLWFLGTLVPVIGLVQVGDSALADRYAYIPLIGIFVMIAWGAADLTDALKLKAPLRVIAAVCVLLAIALVTRRQIGYWSNSVNLWGRTLAVTRNNLIAHRNMASALTEMGRTDEAFEHFKAEAELNPHEMLTQFLIGQYLYSRGKLAEALAQFNKMTYLTSEPQPLAAAYAGMGMVYSDLDDESKAQLSFEESLKLNRNESDAYYGLGQLAEKDGRLEEAIFDYSRLVDLAPTGLSYQRLGHAYELAHRPTEALEAYRLAVKISPQMKQALAPAINRLAATIPNH
jgi:protein O-mannosyl-transferase